MSIHAELLSYATKSLRQRKLRSWLTILGIVIGIGSIVILISLAMGLDASVRDELKTLGSNYIFILPGSFSSSGMRFGPPILKGVLYTRDVDLINGIPGVDSVGGMLVAPYIYVSYKKDTVSTIAMGVPVKVGRKFITTEFEAGGYLSDGDMQSAVIGNDVAHSMFSENVSVGSILKIGARQFRVKGIYKKTGQSGNQLDTNIYVDPRAMRDLLGDALPKNQVSRILVVTKDGANVTEVGDAISVRLATAHKVPIGKEDFSVLTPQAIQDQVNQIFSILGVFLGGIAAISLVVGGIGVANTMFMSVLERTREIGILKALGAKQNVILELFLIESGLIGLMGGFLGILFALLVSFTLNSFGVPSIITTDLLLFSMAFSFVIGVISGFFPARNAAKLDALEALRYE
jgi:putative ABC transport system permease protein